MADQSSQNSADGISNGEHAVIDLLTSVFNVGTNMATQSYMKLKSLVMQDGETSRMLEAASEQRMTGNYDSVLERTRSRAMSWDIAAIVRQVILPLVGGGAGYYIAAGLLGAAGVAPVLIGVLVGAIIWAKNQPGTLEMLKRNMDEALEDIFSPF